MSGNRRANSQSSILSFFPTTPGGGHPSRNGDDADVSAASIEHFDDPSSCESFNPLLANSTANHVETTDSPGPSTNQDKQPEVSISTTCTLYTAHASPSDPLLPLKFHPPISYKLPKRKFGASGERSFKSYWYQQYQWLHYDVSSDAAFCYLCMKAEKEGKLLASTRREPAFISKGFTYWKEATTAFSKHQTSACHKEANEAINLLPNQLLGSVDDLMSQEVQENKSK